MLRKKIKEWVRRYAPAEISGILCSLFFGYIVSYFNNGFFTAIAATWGENVGFYGLIVLKDFFYHKPQPSIYKLFRGVTFEFGPSELFDTFLIRPFFMYELPKITHDLATGIIFGKLLSDFFFYGPTIIAYEVKKKLKF